MLKRLWINFWYKFIWPVKRRSMEISPKGQCIYKYCRNILDGTWTLEENRVEAYEQYIRNCIQDVIDDGGGEVSREEIMDILCEILGGKEEMA